MVDFFIIDNKSFFWYDRNNMKRTLTAILVFILCTSVFAAKALPMPDWVQNYKTVYPSKKYLAQRGTGDTAEKAMTDATAALSRYFQTNVNANLSTTMTSLSVNTGSKKGSSLEESVLVVDEVNVQSQVDFFGLEYTDPYYVKKEKKWYCVVYMDRSEAFTQYKPQIDISRNAFNNYYKKLVKEEDYFTRIGMCTKAWSFAEELLKKLEYARIIDAAKEAEYQKERDLISEIPVILQDAKENCSVFIKVEGDYGRIISTSLSSVFSDSDFSVTKNEAEANYTAEVTVENNEAGSDPLSIKPGVNIKLMNRSCKTVFSYEIIAEKKTVSFTLEGAQKKAYPVLAKELEEAVKNELNSFSKI